MNPPQTSELNELIPVPCWCCGAEFVPSGPEIFICKHTDDCYEPKNQKFHRYYDSIRIKQWNHRSKSPREVEMEKLLIRVSNAESTLQLANILAEIRTKLNVVIVE